MTAQPEGQPAPTALDGLNVIRLGDQVGVVVEAHEYRVLRILREQADPDAVEEAEFDAAIEEAEAWEAAGRPGGTIPHEEVMAELLGGGG